MEDSSNSGANDGPQAEAALPVAITSERIRMILVTPQDAAGMLAGQSDPRWHREYPRREDLDAVALVGRGSADARAGSATWGPRHMVVGREAVGSIGFFGAPVDGEVEVAFGLVPAIRGSGLAAEALAALLVETDRLGVRVRASVAPENRTAVRALASCGFTDLRGSNEDGHLVMGRPLRTVREDGSDD